MVYIVMEYGGNIQLSKYIKGKPG